MAANRTGVASIIACLTLALAGCTASTDAAGRPAPRPRTTPAAEAVATPSASTTRDAPVLERSPAKTPSAPAESAPRPTRTQQVRRASVSIPAIGVHDLRVVAYDGSPDDLPGTRIQNRGVAASPRGAHGGVGPGQVGNFIITAHRLSAGGPFGDLPALTNGEHILVASGGTVYDYKVTRTMTISFRSKASMARQTAPVPGHPGRAATRPMITLSTCATPEDHARGNYWSDELGNPEHRIDKVGVLVETSHDAG